MTRTTTPPAARPSTRVNLLGALLVPAFLLGCETEFKAPEGSGTKAASDYDASYEPVEEPSPTFDQQAADVEQKWQDVQNAGTEQEKMEAANAALNAQQELADRGNDGGGQ